MEALYLLVPFSVLVVFFTIWLFLRMHDSGQFDDMEGPALRILQDDDSGMFHSETAPSPKPSQAPSDRH